MYLNSLPTERPEKTPRWYQVLAEARIALELADGLRQRKQLLTNLPRGDLHEQRHAVMLLPGFATDERVMALMANRLRALGYVVRHWGQGKNTGAVHKLLPPLKMRVAQWAADIGQPISLVGWSLGGYIAREIARDIPAAVAGVITLGSPVIGGPKYTLTAKQYLKKGFDLDAIEREIAARDRVPLQCPVTLLFSRVDGVVSWPATIDHVTPQARHVMVSSSHVGMVFSPLVFRQLAQALGDQRLG